MGAREQLGLLLSVFCQDFIEVWLNYLFPLLPTRCVKSL